METPYEYTSIEQVPPFSIIDSLDKNDAKKVIEKLLSQFRVKDLQEHWKMNKDKYYERVIYKYGIEAKLSGRAKEEIPEDELQIEDIFKMTFDRAKAEIDRMRNTYGNERLKTHWNINNYNLLKVFGKYEIAVQKRKPRSNPAEIVNNEPAKTKTNKQSKSIPLDTQSNTMNISYYPTTQTLPYIPHNVTPIEEDFEGFKIAFKGVFDGEKLVKRLEGLLLALSGDCKYKIALEIIELESDKKEESIETPKIDAIEGNS